MCKYFLIKYLFICGGYAYSVLMDEKLECQKLLNINLNLKVMKFYLIICFALNVTFSFGQKYDFDSATDATLPSNREKVILSRDFGTINNSQQSLKFPSNGSEIIFTDIKNPKEISFEYLPDFIQTGQLEFTILYRKSGSQDFAEFASNSKIVLNKNPDSRVFSQFYISSVLEGTFDIKLLFTTKTLAALYLDKLEFISYEQKEIDALNQERQYTSDFANRSLKLTTKNQIADYNSKVEIVKGTFVGYIDQLRDLSYRSNVLASLSKLVVFVNLRTQMINPGSYNIFNDKIDTIQSYCSPIQKIFLDRIIKDAKPKEFQVPDSTNKRTGIMKIIQVAGEVGNILTGGKLKSVLNSVQGMVTNLFDPEYLKAKMPEVINYVSNNRVKSKPNPDFAKINEMVEQGINLQNFFYNFFDRLEADSKEFNDLVAEFKNYSEKVNELLLEIDLLRKDYFLNGKYEMTDEFYNKSFLAYGSDSTNTRPLIIVKNSVSKYFDNLIIPLDNKGVPIGADRQVNFNALDEANILIKRIKDLGNLYNTYSYELRILFTKVQDDLQKNNPFSIYDGVTKTFIKDHSYKNSFEEYEQLKNQAKGSFSSLKENLHIVLN